MDIRGYVVNFSALANNSKFDQDGRRRILRFKTAICWWLLVGKIYSVKTHGFDNESEQTCQKFTSPYIWQCNAWGPVDENERNAKETELVFGNFKDRQCVSFTEERDSRHSSSYSGFT